MPRECASSARSGSSNTRFCPRRSRGGPGCCRSLPSQRVGNSDAATTPNPRSSVGPIYVFRNTSHEVRGCLLGGLTFYEESSRFGRGDYSEVKLSNDGLGRIGSRVCASINPSTRPTAHLNLTRALPEPQSAVACTPKCNPGHNCG